MRSIPIKEKSHQSAFTLVELLIVISIIAILVGLIFAGTSGLRASAQRATTTTILSVLSLGVERAAMDLGGAISGSQHPLAGNAPLTVGYLPDFADTGNLTYTGPMPPFRNQGGLVDASNMASDDRFADPIAPHLFGMKRWRLKVLGVESERVNPAVRLSDDPDDFGVARYRRANGDAFDSTHPHVWYRQWSQSIRASLGDTFDRLAELGAIRDPDPDAEWIASGRLMKRASGQSAGSWFEGAVLNVSGDDNKWVEYDLPGPYLVDSYGTEILMGNDPAGRTIFVSAGPDRSFRVHPGATGVLNSTDPFAIPASGDHTAEADNIVVFGER